MKESKLKKKNVLHEMNAVSYMYHYLFLS